MPRARNIKPGFFANEDLAELPFETRLLFVGLWTLADRAGRMEVRPKRIKAALFPYDDITVDAGIDALAKLGFVVLYEHNGKRLLEIPSWFKHQNPHKHERASLWPSANDVSKTVDAPCKNDTSTEIARLIPDSLIPDSNKESKATRGTRLPTDWQPDDDQIAFAISEGLTLSAAKRQADAFRDYWTGKATNATKLDWAATWRNWIRRGNNHGKQPGNSAVERVQRNNRSW